ncbi:hypothetical protein ABT369_39420 [Dactylosporangium sp. NPDC000244]|uniref:hypothetical protein n=1 Tax=Dactylosporangium sp. NPDC000244 TaxID=3154365 RepID=UPI00332D1F2F
MNPATRFGPVAEREFVSAADHAKPELTAWLEKLPGLSDDEFTAEAASAIHGSALVQRFKGNWEADHCKASAAFNEASRRHLAAGHTEDCTGDTLYSMAFLRTWRSQGHSPDAYPPRPCDCGAKA